MKKIRRNQNKIFIFLSVFLIIAYGCLIWRNFVYFLSTISTSFGYVDYQHNWRGLEEFIRFRVPFKDYFYEYGWFFLFLQVPAYLFFCRSFLAVLISRHLYLPLAGLLLSYFIALNVLRKKHLIFIFLFFLFLFGTNYDFVSVRHLMAELSLSFFLLSFFVKKERNLFISGFLGGLAILTALEYGIALNIAVAAVFLASFFSALKLKKVFFKKFVLGEIAVLFPFFFWLFIQGALRNYWDFTYGFIKNFYYASPCSGHSFPRLEEIAQLRPTSKLLIFNLPIEWLQRVNFYLVIAFFAVFLFFLLIRLIIKRKFSRDDLIKLSLTIYGLVISLRTLDNPCTGYFSYSLVPFFLLITLLIDEILSWTKRRKPPGLKAIGILGITIIFSWFVLTEYTGSLVKIFGKKEEKPVPKDVYEREFYSPAGWFMRKDLVQDYQTIAYYIKRRSEKNDYLYVYPWGPYNRLTSRKPPTSLTNYLQVSIAGEKFIDLALKELKTKNPKFVIINLYNNLGIAHYGKTRGDVGRYFSLGDKEGPVFAGEGNPIEKFILENYQPVLKNDLAVVMKQRVEPIMIAEKKREVSLRENWEKEKIELELMEETGYLGKYAITGEKASWTFVLEKPIEASDLAVELKLDGNLLTKHLTRYFLNLYIFADDSNGEPHITRSLAWKDWQTVNIAFPEPKNIEKLKIEVGENTGLIWWFNPSYLEIKKIIFYLLSS